MGPSWAPPDISQHPWPLPRWTCDHQRCLQSLPNIPWRAKLLPVEKHYWKLNHELIFQELAGSDLKPPPLQPWQHHERLFQALPQGPALCQANRKPASLCSWSPLHQDCPSQPHPKAHLKSHLLTEWSPCPRTHCFCAQPSTLYHT